jgi:hypothetical protein
MIDWIESVFVNNPDKRFILQSHVYPGNNWYEGFEFFWDSQYLNQYLAIMKQY